MDLEKRRAERALANGGVQAVEVFLAKQRRLCEGPTFSVMDFMLPKLASYCKEDCEGCAEGSTYSWSHQSTLPYGRLGLVEALTDQRLTVEFSQRTGDYQGTLYALLNLDIAGGIKILWRDSFGSCSGCDGLEACAGPSEQYEYIRRTLGEGNTKSFWTVSEACDFLLDTEDYWWNPRHCIDSYDQDYYKFLEKLWEAADRTDLKPVDDFLDRGDEDDGEYYDPS